MLSNYPIDTVLLAMDLAAAKAFYTDTIGLPVLSESPGAVTFQCGGDARGPGRSRGRSAIGAA